MAVSVWFVIFHWKLPHLSADSDDTPTADAHVPT